MSWLALATSRRISSSHSTAPGSPVPWKIERWEKGPGGCRWFPGPAAQPQAGRSPLSPTPALPWPVARWDCCRAQKAPSCPAFRPNINSAWPQHPQNALTPPVPTRSQSTADFPAFVPQPCPESPHGGAISALHPMPLASCHGSSGQPCPCPWPRPSPSQSCSRLLYRPGEPLPLTGRLLCPLLHPPPAGLSLLPTPSSQTALGASQCSKNFPRSS